MAAYELRALLDYYFGFLVATASMILHVTKEMKDECNNEVVVFSCKDPVVAMVMREAAASLASSSTTTSVAVYVYLDSLFLTFFTTLEGHVLTSLLEFRNTRGFH